MQKQSAIQKIEGQINDLKAKIPKNFSVETGTPRDKQRNIHIQVLESKKRFFVFLKDNQNILSDVREIIEKRGYQIKKISEQTGISYAPLFNYIKHGYLNEDFEILNQKGQRMREKQVRDLHSWIQENR